MFLSGQKPNTPTEQSRMKAGFVWGVRAVQAKLQLYLYLAVNVETDTKTQERYH
jgi:hypothetical protein